jgi:hypothetical protein
MDADPDPAGMRFLIRLFSSMSITSANVAGSSFHSHTNLDPGFHFDADTYPDS